MTPRPSPPPTLAALLSAASAARERARQAEDEAQEREQAALLAALDSVSGNQTAAAPLLGLHLRTLKRRLVALGYDAAALERRWPRAMRQPAR